MVSRPCLDCGEPSPSPRCPTHTKALEAARPSRRVLGRYDTRWLKLRAQAIKTHPWCVDCLSPGTPDNPLTGDHRIPLAKGGRNEASNVVVRCRRCNSAKRDRLVG